MALRAIALRGLRIVRSKPELPPVEYQIASAAIEWNRLRAECNELRARRNACECEDGGEDADTCWALHYRQPSANMCPPCRERVRLHAEFRAVVQRRAGARRRLQRLAW